MSRRQSTPNPIKQLDAIVPSSLKRSPYYRPLIALATMILAALGFTTYQPNTTPTTTGLAKGEQTHCFLKSIYDGDTITAICGDQTVRVRLVGIDAPEMKQAPYGERAKSALQRMLPKQFELHSNGTDRYQRTLGILYTQGRNLNLEMVKQGHAVAYADKSTPKIYREAEAIAKAARLGVWREEGLHQDPKAWRKQNQTND
ncbi:MAG: thermonuclease family protein [Cardiobacteriaceae bacterium]|nr:thermonuclease family protein [Cardiobacteriaceae bacterium]